MGRDISEKKRLLFALTRSIQELHGLLAGIDKLEDYAKACGRDVFLKKSFSIDFLINKEIKKSRSILQEVEKLLQKEKSAEK